MGSEGSNGSGHRFVFVAGLHRSGTTVFTKCLAEHPEISSFHDTGVREDEGQFLQTVYPTAGQFGGPGRFGFDPASHLDETSPLVSEASAATIFAEWSSWWDLGRSTLVEKSPPNIVRTRFLQALFPDSYFVFVMRHPVAVTYATFTRRRRKTRPDRLLRHWVVCHERAAADRPKLRRSMTVPYEGFVADPDGWLARTFEFLDLPAHQRELEIRQDTNDRYYEMWRTDQARSLTGRRLRSVAQELEPAVERFGYSLEDLDRCEVPAPGW